MCLIMTNIICVRFHRRTGILAESKTDHIPIFLELPKTVNSGLCVSQGERGGVWVNIHCWISIVSTLHPLSYFIFTTSLDSHVYFLPLIAVNEDSERYSHLSKCTQLVKTGQVLILGSIIPEATFHHTTPFKKERYGNVLPSHLSFFPPNENCFSVQIPKVIQQRSFNILWSISHLRWLCSVRKKIFSFVIFSQTKNQCLLQKCTQYRRVLRRPLSKALSSCCEGHTADRSATHTLSAFLELISWQKGRATGASWGREGQPGLGASGRDRTSTKGKGNLAKEAEAASGWSARHRNRFPPNSVCAKVLRQEGTKPVGGEELGSTRLCEQVGWELESFILRRVSTTEFFSRECKYKATWIPPSRLTTVNIWLWNLRKFIRGPCAHKHRPLTCSNVEWDNTVSLLTCFFLLTICGGHHFRSMNTNLWHFVNGSLVNRFIKRPQFSWQFLLTAS